MTNDNPIGVFDSGIGGTSIWKAIRELTADDFSLPIDKHVVELLKKKLLPE